MAESAPAWLFRVGSSLRWGGGHVTRCLAIARALAESNHEVAMLLDTDATHWQQVEMLNETVAVFFSREALPDRAWCGVLFDTYDLTANERDQLKTLGPCCVVIDDFGQPLPFADLVVTPGHPQVTGSAGGQRLAGSRYALIDERFRDRPVHWIAPSISKIAVSFGRNDMYGGCALALEALDSAMKTAAPMEIAVAVGKDSEGMEPLIRAAESSRHKVAILFDHGDMRGLLESADIAIGAGGVSLYERLACGTPSLTIEIAAAAGATLALGSITAVTVENLGRTIARLATDPDQRRKMSINGQRLIDGRGPQRVAKHMVRLCEK